MDEIEMISEISKTVIESMVTYTAGVSWNIENGSDIGKKINILNDILVPELPSVSWGLRCGSSTLLFHLKVPDDMVLSNYYYSILLRCDGPKDSVTFGDAKKIPISKNTMDNSFITKNSLLNHLHADGSLKVSAILTIMRVTAAVTPFIRNAEAFYRDKPFADFKFVVEGKGFLVHKCILAGASGVFKEFFIAFIKDKKSNKCTLKDIKASVFELLIKFIYTGSAADIGEDGVELYEAACTYNIEDLKDVCVSHMKQLLRTKTLTADVRKIYEFARKYEIKDLIASSWDKLKMALVLNPLPLNIVDSILGDKG